jgi:aminodeoxyfutalosine deaminase
MASPDPTLTPSVPLNTRQLILALPKAELHLHLEGAIAPATVAELAARHGLAVTEEEACQRYAYDDFLGFLQAFKWVTSFLRTPEDYALITTRLADELIAQNVIYAEITVAAGVMLWRGQDARKNLLAISGAGEQARARDLQLRWIPDATRQFGPAPAMEVARLAADLQAAGVAAFGMGGDELSLPASDFRSAYQFARDAGLHLVTHAGEVGGPSEVRDAIAILGAERIGHGIAVIHDPALRAELVARHISLEVCPTSNVCTGALARQLNQLESDAIQTTGDLGTTVPSAGGCGAEPASLIAAHPLKSLFDQGLHVTLSTDDPAMFHTTLLHEYAVAANLGFSPAQLMQLAENSFHAAFLPPREKSALLARFRTQVAALKLI